MVMYRFKCELTQKVFSYLIVTYYYLLIKLHSVLLKQGGTGLNLLHSFSCGSSQKCLMYSWAQGQGRIQIQRV